MAFSVSGNGSGNRSLTRGLSLTTGQSYSSDDQPAYVVH